MKVFGQELTKKQVTDRIGDITQWGGIKNYEFSEGQQRGIRAIDIKNACGLDMTVTADRGMDISYLSYKSVPISWRSAVRETSPVYYESRGLEWLRTFFGGLLTTCGLTHIGPPGEDQGQTLGQHGRISNLPAYSVCTDGDWIEDNYRMAVQGKVREASVFGDKLELTRKITVWMDSPVIVLEDTVENIGSQVSPLMVLYHINIGYPVVDTGTELVEDSAKVSPRDQEAKKNINSYHRFEAPANDYQEQVFFHDIEADNQGFCRVGLVNTAFDGGRGIGIGIKYHSGNLPYFIQWKMMGCGEYVCGLEPANSLIRGRAVEREKGNLKFIEPGQKIGYHIEFQLLGSIEEIDNFKKVLR